MPRNASPFAPKLLVLWDGECPMCARCVHWLVRHDKRNTVQPCAFQDAPTPPMTPQLREACAHALHAIEPDGTVLKGARAVFRAGEATRYRRLARVLAQPPIVWAAELVYRAIAANRSHIGGYMLPNEPKQEREPQSDTMATQTCFRSR